MTCLTFLNQCHPIPRSQHWAKIIASFYKTGIALHDSAKVIKRTRGYICSMKKDTVHASESSSRESKAGNYVKWCFAEAKVCCWLSHLKEPQFPTLPWQGEWRQTDSRVGISTCPQSSTPCIWAAVTATASWTHTGPYTKPISSEIEITPLSRTKIQTPCSFRLLQSDWFTDVSYMRAEREAMEVGEERRRDREGTEVTFTCRWSYSSLVLMMSAPPAVCLQSQTM